MSVKKCIKCGKCCYCSTGPIVFPSDVKRISRFLKINPKKLLEKYCQKLYVEVLMGKFEIYHFNVTQGHCIFLTQNNLCDIYNVRPYQCINAPYKFLSSSGFWNHIPCLDKAKLKRSNSQNLDSIILCEIINEGYDIFKEV